RRLDAAHQRNLTREQRACLHEELPFARRELRLRSFWGHRPLALRAVADELGELDGIAAGQLRLRVLPAREPGLSADDVIRAQHLLYPRDVRLAGQWPQQLVRALDRQLDGKPARERKHDHLL